MLRTLLGETADGAIDDISVGVVLGIQLGALLGVIVLGALDGCSSDAGLTLDDGD